jgi:cobalt-zinc-cadmium efflux system protein
VTQSQRLAIVLTLNMLLIVGLVIVGLNAHSLGVLAAGGDSVADSLAIGLGLFAIYVRERSGGNSKATTRVAAVNATLLLLITGAVAVEGIRRLLAGSPEVHGLPVLIASTVTMVVMSSCAVIAGGDDDDDDLHMRSIVLDTVADAISAGAVAVTGAVILWTGGFYWLDPAVALIIGVVIGYQAIRLLRAAVRELRNEPVVGGPAASGAKPGPDL